MTTAIVLFSGGLDSLLTTRILQKQNIDVIGLNVVTPFQDSSAEAAEWAEKFGIELVVRRLGADYVRMLAHPRWGIGKGVNPCIDCRIAMCRAAGELMEERGADFVATGEVAGQRPNSQKLHQLNLITRESGLKGKLLRPLSAKTLPPTEMEETGLVDREGLYSYTGRSRGRLIRRAREAFGIRPIPQPSTGCLLSEKSFAPRVKDLLAHKPDPTLWDVESLLVGRHLRIDDRTKAVVSRFEKDGAKMIQLFRRADRSRSFLMTPENFNGPAVLLVAESAPAEDAVERSDSDEMRRCLDLAGGLVLRFCNREKWAYLDGAPTVNLFWGIDGKEILPIFPSEEADSFAIIEEWVRPTRSKQTADPDEPGNNDAPEKSDETEKNDVPQSGQKRTSMDC